MNTVPAVYVNIIKWKFNSNWVCLLNWKLLGCEHSYISVQIAVSLELHELSIRIKPIPGAVAGGAYISHSLQPVAGDHVLWVRFMLTPLLSPPQPLVQPWGQDRARPGKDHSHPKEAAWSPSNT